MNLTLHDVDGGYQKRECEIETEKCSDVLQLWDLARRCRMLRKFKEFQRFECRPHGKQRKCFTEEEWSCSNRTIDRKLHAEEEGKRETVFD